MTSSIWLDIFMIIALGDFYLKKRKSIYILLPIVVTVADMVLRLLTFVIQIDKNILKISSVISFVIVLLPIVYILKNHKKWSEEDNKRT